MEGLRILLVEDVEPMLLLLEMAFKAEGCVVYCARNGREALEILSGHGCDILLTDLRMPGMDGLELARAAKRISSEITVLITTGDASPEIYEEAKEIGVSRVIAKPFRYGELLDAVAVILSARKAGPLNPLTSGSYP
jgi:CheY-like chemotaxis protein